MSVAVAACDTAPVEEPSYALFEVPRGGVATSDFYALPFPNDIRRDDQGHPILDDHPRPNVLLDPFVAACETLDGFGTNSAIFLRFSVSVEAANLPPDASAAVADNASVYLVDLSPESPTYGQRHPIRLRFQSYAGWTIGANWLAALPYPGFPLRERTTYGLVVTSRINTADLVIEPARDFLDVIGTTAPVDQDLLRANQRYQPLVHWLDETGGDERADVLSAAVFTTQSVTGIMGKLRERVRSLPAPVARAVVAVPSGAQFFRYGGVFDAPNFQTGTAPYAAPADGGDIIDGPDGLPMVQRMEELRFAVTLPPAEMPADGWPIAIYAHGTSGDAYSFVRDGTAGRLAAEGIAVISIDQVLHGPRNPGGNPELDFFNFLNPLSARNNAIQGAADDFSVVRLIETFEQEDPPDPMTGAPGRTVRFDPSNIFFFGHSQGGITGPPFIAYEPQVKGSVLSGAGGLLISALLKKNEPVDIAGVIENVIADRPLDEFNPTLSILQTWIERSDPVNYGPLLVRETPADISARPVYQSMGFVDHFTPLPSIEALAVSIGGDLAGPPLAPVDGLTLRGRQVVASPVADNVDGTTAVLVQYPATSEGHFVVFDVPAARRQSAQFLGTLARTGTATLVP